MLQFMETPSQTKHEAPTMMTPRKERKPTTSKDRRIPRTRRILRDALIQLIIERGWNESSILDICERANVGRSTFYTHFADKEELLLSGFEDLRRMVRMLGSEPAWSPMSFIRPMVEHAYENVALFRALLNKSSENAMRKHFQRLVMDLVEEDIASIAPTASRADVSAVSHYIGGAFLELLTTSLQEKTPPCPVQLAEVLCKLTAPVLATLTTS
jgi:AcrR family transcriptional regulator